MHINFRSISKSENSQNICNIPTHQEPNGRSVEFTSAKKLFKRPSIRACVTIGKKATTAANKIIERPKEVYSVYYNNMLGSSKTPLKL